MKRREQRAPAARRTGAQDVAGCLLLGEGSLSGLGRVPGVAKDDHGPGESAQPSQKLGSRDAIGRGRDLSAERVGEQPKLQQQHGSQQRRRCPAVTAVAQSRAGQPGEQRDRGVGGHQHVRVAASVQARHPGRADQSGRCARVVHGRRTGRGERLGAPCERHAAAENQGHEWPLLAQDVVDPEPDPPLVSQWLSRELAEDVVPVPAVGRRIEHSGRGDHQDEQGGQRGDAYSATGDGEISERGEQCEHRGLLGEEGEKREHPEGDAAAHAAGDSPPRECEQGERQEQRVDSSGVEPRAGDLKGRGE